jgi:hypothetical protein
MDLAWIFVKAKRRPAAKSKSNAAGAWLKVKASLREAGSTEATAEKKTL